LKSKIYFDESDSDEDDEDDEEIGLMVKKLQRMARK